MIAVLYVALGGAIGASARYLMMSVIGRLLGGTFPYGTLAVNILGSFAMGLLVGWMAKESQGDQAMRLLLAVGVLGGFTTFSAFSLDVATLFERGEYVPAMLYVLASVILSVLGLFAGLMIIRGAA